MESGLIQEVFASNVDRYPSNPAILGPRGVLTYRELDEKSNNFANFLIENGAEKGTLVAILMEDTVDAITAILGILKAGCVFVPLDTGFPVKRLSMLMEEVQPQWYVTEPDLLTRLREALGKNASTARVFCASGEEKTRSEPPLNFVGGYQSYTNPARPNIRSLPDDMCYVYFTSGSMGNPKGIAGRLKGIDHFIRWEIETLGLGEGIRASQLLSISFDGSLRDIFVPLCCGGTVCVPERRELVMDGAGLVEMINRYEIELIHCIPSLIRLILNQDLNAGDFRSLKNVMLSGEALLPGDVGRWTDIFGDRIRLVNLYGTSETTMAKFFYYVTAADKNRTFIPIGKPMPGARALVVDRAGNPCPPNVVGEIYIRTPYRTLGYYNRPDLTREAFIRNPFSDDPDDIIYKTGDLGRLLDDGNYEYLGRKDDQVKIRGIRVELREIEDILRRHEAVSDAAVVDRTDKTGQKYLCAYVVLNKKVSPVELRNHVAAHLPEYMAPSQIVAMEQLPRTTSGKIDRRALPQPEILSRTNGKSARPSTPIEDIVAGIWMQVLGIKEVGVDDNFFTMGGHSLLSTLVMSRLRSAFQVEFPLRSLFENPTIEGLARIIGREIGAGPVAQAMVVEPAGRDGELPVSFAQQRLWFFDQLEPASPVYNLDVGFQLTGSLNAATLGQALSEIARRHEILRTSFDSSLDGRPKQLIAQVEPAYPAIIDMSGLLEESRSSVTGMLAREMAGRGFDLRQSPVWRAAVLRESDNKHTVLFTMHHIVGDAWSIQILTREVTSLYQRFLAGSPSTLPELSIQYADYSVWQRKSQTDDTLKSNIEYWKKQLADAPPVLELPTDRARPAVESFSGGWKYLTIADPSPEILVSLGYGCDATLFMTLLAAFKALLSRYTGKEDIVVGAPISTRTRKEFEDLIGFFVNTLALRTNLSGNPSFREIIGRVRDVSLQAYAHQEAPFERLVSELQVERNPSYARIVQAIFNLVNVPEHKFELPNLSWDAIAPEMDYVRSDLSFNLRSYDGKLALAVGYNSDLFDDVTITRIARGFLTLLGHCVANPDARLSELRLLSESEEHCLLNEWNDTAATLRGGLCAHELFEEQAERTPDALALGDGGHGLTYRCLNERSNQLAHHLKKLGVGPQVLVGVSLEKSSDLVIGILGVLKSGAAYVPLDPDYPPDRLAFMLEDAAPPVVITKGDAGWRLPVHSAKAIDLDEDAEAIAKEPKQNPTRSASLGDVAYVIYTSGSTGRPKGVEVEHRGVLNLVDAQAIRTLHIRSDDRVLQFASASFDASVSEMVMALCNGSTLFLVGSKGERGELDLVALIREENVTTATFPPSLMSALDEESFPALSTVLSAGEACGREMALSWSKGRRFFNAYGPTEASVCATMGEFRGDQRKPAIGRPIANVQIYLLDSRLAQAPAGSPGEIYIGGIGVARGYLNCPDLTADRFLPDPLGPRPGARIYRTGDLARYRNDGQLDFLGRVDRQLKVHGFRIEPGEIEAVIRQYPCVEQVAVATREDSHKHQRIVAYIVGNANLIAHELGQFAKQRLPGFMSPSDYVFLDKLPLTANGKIDWGAFPAPGQSNGHRQSSFVPPSNPAQEKLAGIFKDVLGLQQVSIHDSFFELGGDSILAIQICARANQIGLRLTPGQIFEGQTIARLLALAGSTAAVEAEQGLVTGGACLTPIQRWFFEQKPADPAHYNQSIILKTRQRPNLHVLKQAIDSLHIHHDALRSRFVRSASGWDWSISGSAVDAEVFSVDLADLRSASRAAAIEAVANRLQTGLDLSSGRLLAAAYIDLGHDEMGRLLIVAHHLVVDGVSWRILLEDLQSVYQQIHQGIWIQLPAKTSSYKQWANQLVEYSQSIALQREAEFWLGKIASPTARLPIDFLKGENTVLSARMVSVSLSREQTVSLLKEAPKVSRTEINDLLLTALVWVLSRWTKEESLLLDLEGHGREDLFPGLDVSRTVGWFTSLFPVLLDIRGASGLGDSIKAVKRQLRRIPNRGVGYGILRYLSENADLADKFRAQPEAQISFNYLGQFDNVLKESSAFELATESSGLACSPHALRPHVLEITAFVVEEQLQVSWRYSAHIHRISTIETLAYDYRDTLKSLIAYCLTPDAGEIMSADLLFAETSQDELDRALEEIEFEEALEK